MNNKEITLKGNEFGWILKLAEERYVELKSSGKLKEYEVLDNFLSNLLGRFHSNNFYSGSSETIWILTRIDNDQKGIKINEPR